MSGLQRSELNENLRKLRSEPRRVSGVEDEMLQIWDDFDGHVQLTPSQALQLLDYLQEQAETLRNLQE
jgi:hypothetical protein